MTNASLKTFFGFIFLSKKFGVKAECLIVAKVKKNHMLCLEKNENFSKFFSKTNQISIFWDFENFRVQKDPPPEDYKMLPGDGRWAGDEIFGR